MNYHRPNNYYIWQMSEWPAFHWDDLQVYPQLLQAKSRVMRLLGMVDATADEQKRRFSLDAMTTTLVDSSAIEGQVLDMASVRSSLANRLGVQLAKAVQPDHYTEGLVLATLDAVQGYNQPLTADRLFGWHAALFPTGYSGPYKITVANWRQSASPMLVVSGAMGHERVHYEAPPSHQVPSDMQRLISWVESPSGTEPLVRAAVAHLWFVAIHPFDDGNGRIARTLTDLMLCRHDRTPFRYYSPTTHMLAHRKEYYSQLEHASTHSMDITSWVLWFLRAVEQSVDSTVLQLQAALDKQRFHARHDIESLNPRQRKNLKNIKNARFLMQLAKNM